MSATNIESYHRRTVVPEPNSKILVCNAGSSSLKFSFFDSENEMYLGLELDRTANKICKPDADIARPASTVRILVIAAREDLTIMRETRQLVGLSTTRQRGDENLRPSLMSALTK